MAVMNTLPWTQMRQWPTCITSWQLRVMHRQLCMHEWVRDIPGGGVFLGGKVSNGASRSRRICTGRGRAARDKTMTEVN